MEREFGNESRPFGNDKSHGRLHAKNYNTLIRIPAWIELSSCIRGFLICAYVSSVIGKLIKPRWMKALVNESGYIYIIVDIPTE